MVHKYHKYTRRCTNSDIVLLPFQFDILICGKMTSTRDQDMLMIPRKVCSQDTRGVHNYESLTNSFVTHGENIKRR